MTWCTEPERWARPPGADAPEEEVESYLAHVGVCPFHAGLEQREEELVRGIAAHARLDPGARRLTTAQRAARPSAEPARATRRYPVRRLAVALCVLAAVVLLALALFRTTERPAPVVQQEQPSPPPTPESAPPARDTQNRQDVAPPALAATPRTSQGNVRVAPTPRSRERLTVADVRRIYVSAGEGADDRQLREALIARLRAGDRFTVVTGERQADAVLLREQPRGAGVSVQLVTRGGKTLWFTTQPTASGGVEDVNDLAARIVAALTAAADKRPPTVNAP
ncbi:MAG TPA: hypothetical protein VF297_17765 [Pyrinomonadaceae bacterium]